MTGYVATWHGCGDPVVLKAMPPVEQVSALTTHESAPFTRAAALALINHHIAAGTLIPLNGCANPCPRLGCAGFGRIARGCGGYSSKGAK